ncbi:TonB-dependent receptor domain-containing protein [Pelistega ratti]|uniref:TonB-dependent receptor domain-containing protein n=1 Tax=Pelistega ratti TaxID=2652177 RepID=UPI00135AC03E|nr:TonB-dependent receptor [Pelistega ratti]
MNISPLKVAIMAAFVPVCAFAQENTTPLSEQLDPIVVTASRTPETLKNVVGDVTVVDSYQLRNSHSLTIADILKKQAGIQTYNNGGSQTTTGVFIRGVAEKQSLIMINGIRINETFNGGAYWSALSPATFNRLEIVRGASSSLYGSSALGGVINAISTPADTTEQGNHFFAGIGAGSRGKVNTYAGVNGVQGNFDYHLAGSFARADGFNATTPESGTSTYNADRDGYKQATLNGALGYKWADGQHIGITFFNGYSHNDYDAGLLTNNIYDITRQQVYTVTSTNQITPWWQSILRFGFSKTSYFTPSYDADYGYGVSTNPAYRANSYQRQLTWQNNFSLDANNSLSTIVERNIESGVANNYAPTKSHRTTNALGLIYRGHFNRHHIQASIRNDNFSDYGHKVTGSLGYDFDITNALSIGIAGNTGFRAPTFQEQFGTYGGNKTIAPEKSRNIEAHITYRTDSTTLQATVFHNTIKDLIISNGQSYPNNRLENIGKAKIKGISLTAEHDFGSTQIYAGADFLNAKNDITGERLIRRAKAIYRAGITQQIGNYEVGADYLFVGHRTDTDFNTSRTVRLGGYGLVNLRASVNFNEQLSAQFSINNLFDKHYTPAYGYKGEGRTYFLNLAYQH